MGRKLRMVPPNWQHPTNDRGHLQPMYDEHIDTAMAEWQKDLDRVRKGRWTKFERECYEGRGAKRLAAWLHDHPAPNPDYYRPWKDSEATWFQVWETVSEGTPVTPPFSTKEELVDYLVISGDFWQQKRWQEGNRLMQPKPPGYSREAAESFVESGWAPSMVIMNGRMAVGIDAAAALKAKS